MEKVNVYDWDKTIFPVDSTVAFVRWCLWRHPGVIRALLGTLVLLPGYWLGKVSKTAIKERMYGFLRRVPDVDAALRILEYQFASAAAIGERVVKVVHGCGSTVRGGGRLRTEVRRWGRKDKRVGLVVKGENFSAANPQARYLVEKFPHVAADEDLEKQNEEITLFFIHARK